MTQRPTSDHGGSRNDPTPTSEPTPNPEPSSFASFDRLLSLDDPRPAGTDDPDDHLVDDLVDGRVPLPVLRHWSDALAAAGLYGEALLTHPAVERADVVRRAELAVLSGDPRTALALLAELDAARTLRTSHGPDARPGEDGNPWLDLLTWSARVQSGELGLLPDVLAAARRVRTSAGVAWVVALSAITAGDLDQAATAAVAARAGGCRDLRILAISAADRAADHDDWAAIELIRGAQRVALPDEDPAGLTVTLLEQTGYRADAQRLAARAATDASLSAPARAAWQEAARRVGAGRKQMWRRSMTAAGSMATRRREQAEQARVDAAMADLTCRCHGSTGWIGENRMFYVSRHLNQVLPAPVAGLPARLMRCRATRLTFLDLPGRQLTLPVAAEARAARPPVDPFADPDADPEAKPTPGMGVSLGLGLFA